jgi:hypothetical protein
MRRSIGVIAALGLTGLAAGRLPAAVDVVTFGDAASEQAHALAAEKTAVAAGGLGQPCRRLEPGGALVFQLVCDPDAQNYLTVKFWGSDTDPALVFLYNGDKRVGDYMSAWPELDLCRGEAAFPGRFYYTTYMIPDEMTRGRTAVTLRLAAIGGVNPYAEPGKRERPLAGPSRGFYRAYSHTDPFFTPGADQMQGQAPPARLRPAVAPAAALEQLRKDIDQAVARTFRWQLYGPEWDAAVARGAPAVLTGATLRPTGLQGLAAEGWKDAVARRATDGNATAMNVLGILARAYVAPWSGHCGNAELLDRVARGLDYCCAAQGAGGGFAAKGWVGGPDRKPAGSCLEGFGTAGPGDAFVAVQKELAAKGLLDRGVDHDGDPRTPPAPRRQAWADMFARHRDFLASAEGRGHATNQDLAQMTALWPANEALRTLAPDKAWPREKALSYIRAAVGLAKDPLGGYWVTRKGLCLEPWGTLGGGYCGNYGLMSVHEVARLADLTRDPAVCVRAALAVRAAAFFVYPSVDAEGFACLRREEVISTRNNNWPGRVDYGGDEFVAAQLKDPVAIRAAQLYVAMDGRRSVLEEKNAHFIAGLVGAMRNEEYVAALPALPPSAARLPMEDAQPDFAWTDEQAGAVVVRHGGMRLYAALNWRRGFSGAKRDPEHTVANNIARVHCTTATIDRIATIVMESPHGFGKLYLCRYGPYLVGMNLSEADTYEAPVPPEVAGAADLVSGQTFAAGRPALLPPLTTRVLYLGERR